jgi:MFS transporter, ACS family, solute carrier family 17 (sodium-dependent inorganic phosphate cotransporter), other
MDKVNISIAIIPMAQDYGWSPTVAGLVQSSFFYGYFLSQLPGGSLTNAIGGRKTLPSGVALWSLATAGVPLLASTLPGLYLSRAAVGLGEGIAPAAATDMVARVICTEERSRAISFVFGGLHVGSLLGLLVAPYIIETFGWESVFYLFGVVGLGWCVWWEGLMDSLVDDEVMKKLMATKYCESSSTSSGTDITPKALPLPWRAFLRNGPVRALSFTHFCNNWFHYTMLAWLPTYFIDTLSLDLTRAAQLSLLPPIAAIACSAIAGPAADALIERGVEVEKVRKAAQSAAFLIPAAFLLAAGVLTNSLPSSGIEGGEFSLSLSSSGAVVALITMALGVASFSLAGLYCNHADLSPRYAPVLLGLTNTSGALPGIAGVATTGALYDATGSWPLALFAPSVVFFVLGTGVFVRFGSSERQDFDGEEVNRPFGFEETVSKVFKK